MNDVKMQRCEIISSMKQTRDHLKFWTNKIYSNEKNGISCGSSKIKATGFHKIYRNGATGLYIYKSKNADIRKEHIQMDGRYHIDRNIPSAVMAISITIIIAEKKSKLKLEGGTVAKNMILETSRCFLIRCKKQNKKSVCLLVQ